MREIWISLGVMMMCGVLLVLSTIFGLGNQTAIAEEISVPSAAIQVAENISTQETKDIMDLDLSKAVTEDSGLKYIDQKVGEGKSPMEAEMVTVHYTGRLTNGEVFDSSVERDKPFSFVIGVGQVIKGWDEGVASMKVGGKRTLIIPPELGYGSRGAGGVIPPNATLIFDVELLSIR